MHLAVDFPVEYEPTEKTDSYLNKATVTCLLDAKVDINAQDTSGNTPLYNLIMGLLKIDCNGSCSAVKGTLIAKGTEVAKCLIEYNPDVYAQDEDGNTLVHLIALSGNKNHTKQ